MGWNETSTRIAERLDGKSNIKLLCLIYILGLYMSFGFLPPFENLNKIVLKVEGCISTMNIYKLSWPSNIAH